MNKTLFTASLGALSLAMAGISATQAQNSDYYLGDVIMVGFTFCPQGFASANGDLLTVISNDGLFARIGCPVGVECRTTFPLPDLRGRVPIGMGQGPGLSNYYFTQRGGAETVVLDSSNLPNHRHSLLATNAGNDVASPSGNAFTTLTGSGEFAYNTGVDIAFESDALSSSGNNQPISVLSASLGIRYCVAVDGPFPPEG